MGDVVAAVNAGSSSLKFAVFGREDLTPLLRGEIERIGADAQLAIVGEAQKNVDVRDAAEAVALMETLLSARAANWTIRAVAHRVVHGGALFTEPTIADDAVLARLAELVPFAPMHQPASLDAIRRFAAAFPNATQIACFDTAFHASAPRVAQTFALPARFYDEGLRRFGFHGLSYHYVAEHLMRTRPDLAAGRVIAAHLGSGASLCAMRAGASVATTMGLTALDGVPMGTRPGALDAGLVLHLARAQGVDAAERMLYCEAGLKGLSGLSGDMRMLRASAAPAARFAIDVFVARVAEAAAALTVALGGIDALVFTGGIGANDAATRDEVAAKLRHLGGFEVLSFETDEEAVMAAAAQVLLGRSFFARAK
jgi:acetate kinase